MEASTSLSTAAAEISPGDEASIIPKIGAKINSTTADPSRANKSPAHEWPADLVKAVVMTTFLCLYSIF